MCQRPAAGMLKCILLLFAASVLQPHQHSACAAPVEVSDLLDELKALRAKSTTGVITFSKDEMFTRYGAGRKRPYDLFVFLTARQILSNTQLNMQGLAQEFALAAKAARSGTQPDANFWVEAWYEDVPEVFRALKAQQVPFIFRIRGNVKFSLKDFSLPAADKMTFETYGANTYPWKAEEMLAYFDKEGDLEYAPVHRPSLLKSPWLPFMIGGVLAVVFMMGYAVWYSGILFHPLPWALLSLGVFWFSVSGGMYNIIRGMPFFIRDQQGKLQFFLNSRGGQLGAEGFIMGSGYILFSLAVSMLTYAVPRVRNAFARHLLSIGMVAAAAFMLQKLFVVFQGKTGYRISSYLLR